VQDSCDHYTVGLDEIEHDMPTDLESSQTRADGIALAANGGVPGQKIESVFKFGEI
jgi:hypothetical protein